jgi:hypothetical protein
MKGMLAAKSSLPQVAWESKPGQQRKMEGRLHRML